MERHLPGRTQKRTSWRSDNAHWEVGALRIDSGGWALPKIDQAFYDFDAQIQFRLTNEHQATWLLRVWPTYPSHHSKGYRFTLAATPTGGGYANFLVSGKRCSDIADLKSCLTLPGRDSSVPALLSRDDLFQVNIRAHGAKFVMSPTIIHVLASFTEPLGPYEFVDERTFLPLSGFGFLAFEGGMTLKRVQIGTEGTFPD